VPAMTRIYLCSNVLTAVVVGALWLLHASIGGMIFWLLLLSGYLLAMLWWLIKLEHVDNRLLPSDDAPLFPEPLQLIGASEKGRPPANHTESLDPSVSAPCKCDRRCS
jgi:hypothetical protein